MYYDAIVFFDGSKTVAESADGTEIASGSFTTSLLAAISHIASGVVVLQGHLTADSQTYIKSKSGIELVGDECVITANRLTNTTCIRIEECADIKISCIEFTRADAHTAGMLSILASSDVEVSDCTFRNFYSSINAGGTSAARISNLSILRNEIVGYTSSGIVISDACDDVVIDSNIIHDGVDIGLSLMYGIANGLIGASGLENPQSNRITITNNMIYNQPVHNAIDAHGANDLIITGNEIFDIAGTAIYAHNVWDVSFPTENRENTAGCTIQTNVVHGANAGIIVNGECPSFDFNNIRIANNTVYQFNTTGIKVGSGGWENAVVRAVVVANNLIYGRQGAYLYATGVKIDGTDIEMHDCSVCGNTISGVPHIINENIIEIGINTINTDNIIIHDNTVSDCKYGIRLNQFTHGPTTAIIENVIVNSVTSDILIASGEGIQTSLPAKKLSGGSITADDDAPVLPGESVFSGALWRRLIIKEGSEANVIAKFTIPEIADKSRDVMQLGNAISYIDRTSTCATIGPENMSIIYETNWRTLVGEPGEGETFEQREADYIKALGLVVSE